MIVRYLSAQPHAVISEYEPSDMPGWHPTDYLRRYSHIVTGRNGFLNGLDDGSLLSLLLQKNGGFYLRAVLK